MTMTYSSTYTVIDIRRVLDSFAADYDMIAQSTGLVSRSYVDEVVHDIRILCEHDYVSHLNIVLLDAAGTTVQARKYEISTSAYGWANDRPSNNLWPRLDGGRLSIVINYNSKWDSLGSTAQADFRQKHLTIGWVTTRIDTSYPGLAGKSDRKYSSNGYGVSGTTYSKG